MCVGPLSPKVPTPPPPPPPPPAPPPTPEPQDPAVVRARKRDKQLAALAGGRQANIATTALGLLSEARTTKKTTLGG